MDRLSTVVTDLYQRVQFITDHHLGLAPSHILFKNKLLRNSVI